jgi:hypothetical protein
MFLWGWALAILADASLSYHKRYDTIFRKRGPGSSFVKILEMFVFPSSFAILMFLVVQASHD